MKQYKLKKPYLTERGYTAHPQTLEWNTTSEVYALSLEGEPLFYGLNKEFVKNNTEFFEEMIEKPDVSRWDNGAIRVVPSEATTICEVFRESTTKYYTKNWPLSVWDNKELIEEDALKVANYFLTKEEAEEECRIREAKGYLKLAERVGKIVNSKKFKKILGIKE